MDILKGNVLSLIVIADKILLKTIKVTISDCLIYMPKVAKLFFKPLLLTLIEPYQQKQEDVKVSVLLVYLIFYANQAGLTTAEVDQIKQEVGFIQF